MAACPLRTDMVTLAYHIDHIEEASPQLLQPRLDTPLVVGMQAEGTLPAGTLVSALLIADISAMPVVEGVAITAQPAAM